LIVNVPAAVIFSSSGVDAAMAYGPAGDEGTVTVQVNEPSPATFTVPSLHDELGTPK
jgi:hypothetical protein